MILELLAHTILTAWLIVPVGGLLIIAFSLWGERRRKKENEMHEHEWIPVVEYGVHLEKCACGAVRSA